MQTLSAAKPKGILMKGEMVRATMRPVDPKRQTRRLGGLEVINQAPDNWMASSDRRPDGSLEFLYKPSPGFAYAKPNYQKNQILYVKETWRARSRNDRLKPTEIPPGSFIEYKADNRNSTPHGMSKNWRTPLFMCPWMARIWLRVTNVRVERLQDISEEDAIAEGLSTLGLSTLTKDGRTWKWGIPDQDGLPGNDDHGWHWNEWCRDPRIAYRTLWEKINGLGSWDANPFVFAYTFERIEKPTL